MKDQGWTPPPEVHKAVQDLREMVNSEMLIVSGFDVGGEGESEEHLDTFVGNMKMLSGNAPGVSITAVAVGGLLQGLAEEILGDHEVEEIDRGPPLRVQ